MLLASTGVAYADEGIATWYGPGFHGNVMANGQTYDMYDPTTTAANNYPFGTWLLVTNLANGLTVTVQVRDRGGFRHALDLSYAAFALLDDPKKMQIKVRYEVISSPEEAGVRGDNRSSRGGQRDPKGGTLGPSVPVPSAPPPAVQAVSPAAPPADAPAEYVVKVGDTLDGIAARLGVDPKTLESLNGIDNPDRIVAGQKLRIPASGSRQSKGASGAPPTTVSSQKEYVVQDGDTLEGIALRFGSSGTLLAEINGIRDLDHLSVGMQLRLEQKQESDSRVYAVGARTHTVAAGETLGDIAERYGVTQRALVEVNGLADANRLAAGQQLRLPTESTDRGSQSGLRKGDYVIQAGDTLSGVAQKLDVDVDSLLARNGIKDPGLIQPGQIIRTP